MSQLLRMEVLKLPKIIIAEHAGTCFGVDNAIKIAFEAAKRSNGDKLHILGELVHNPYVVKKLEDVGVIMITDYNELKESDSVIIRAHGETKKVYDFCKKNDIKITDCTCPFVKRAQDFAIKLEEDGYQVMIIGDPEHPEVRGIVAHTENAIVVSNPEDVKNKIKKFGKIGVLSQTTQTLENFRMTVAEIVLHAKKLKIHNTICDATEKRQNAAMKLAREVDTMIIIGGRNSSNTKKLYLLCNDIVESSWIIDDSELTVDMVKGFDKIGITAGASTPNEIIDKVKNRIDSLVE